MNTAVTSLNTNSFILRDDGIYVGTIKAEVHGFSPGSSIYISKAVHRNSDLSTENILISYQVEASGDIKVFVDEPTSMRLTIVCD